MGNVVILLEAVQMDSRCFFIALTFLVSIPLNVAHIVAQEMPGQYCTHHNIYVQSKLP